MERMLRQKKAVIFDMDGTMVDNINYHVESWIIYLNERGIRISDREAFYKGIIHKPLKYLSSILNLDGNSEEMKECENEKEKIYRQLYAPHLKELDGLIPFLDQLKAKKFKLGIGTLANAENVTFTIGGLGLEKYFDAITKREDVKKGKPDPEVYLLSLYKLGVTAEEALVLEDSEAGILAAKQAGIDVIGVSTSNNPEELKAWGAVMTIRNYLNIAL